MAGVTSSSIALSQGDYASGTDLAAELEARIKADANLAAAGAEVSVSLDGVNKCFAVTSTTDGVDSGVSLTDLPALTATSLGFFVGAGTSGKAESTVSDAADGRLHYQRRRRGPYQGDQVSQHEHGGYFHR